MSIAPPWTGEAWQVYDGLLEDDRVALFPEPAGLEALFREMSASLMASPKAWTPICWLLPPFNRVKWSPSIARSRAGEPTVSSSGDDSLWGSITTEGPSGADRYERNRRP